MATPSLESLPPIERAIAKHELAWAVELYVWELRNGLRPLPFLASDLLRTLALKQRVDDLYFFGDGVQRGVPDGVQGEENRP